MCAAFLIVSLAGSAQEDVTRFLGIPVDGSKAEMIRQLKSKGFKSKPYEEDVLRGEFNGVDVDVYIATNKGKVSRIMVCENNLRDETDIRIRFNNLCRQFKNNDRYIEGDNELIPENEDISYEMAAHNKRYSASYYQRPDSAAVRSHMQNLLLSKYTEEQLSNMTEEEATTALSSVVATVIMDSYLKNSVWFMIDEFRGEYRILLYYDNKRNRANGEDL